jgi:hypothetical protein
LGALGEFIGAMLLFASFIFVGLQLRQTNQGMRVAAKLEITRQFIDYVDMLINNPELSEVYERGLGGESLEGTEEVTLNYLFSKSVWYYSSMFYQKVSQNLTEDEWLQSKSHIGRVARQIGFQKWWVSNNRREDFPGDFVTFLESHWET